MTSAQHAQLAGFQLRLPKDWYDFSVADETSENTIAQDIWQRCRQVGVAEAQAREFAESVRRSVRHARQSGALHAGSTFELYDDEPFSATVVVSMVTPPVTGDILQALLAAGDATTPGGGTWHRVGTVHLPEIGTVGRVHGIEDVSQDGQVMRCAVMHTVIPLPDTTSLLVVTGSSPNIAEKEAVFGLFSAITDTLALTRAS